MSTSIEININNTCRTCLSQNVQFNSIYETIGYMKSTTFKDIMLELVKTEVDDCHGLPIVICRKCTGLLKDFYNFRIKCEESEKVLLESMNSLISDGFNNFGTQANGNVESSSEKNSIASLDFEEIVKNKYPKIKFATFESEMNSSELHLLKEGNVHGLNSPTPVTICLDDDDDTTREEEANVSDSHEINSENDDSEENFIILSESSEYLCVPHGLKQIECKICDYRTHKIYKIRKHLKQHTFRLKHSPENIKLDKIRTLLEDESTGRYTDDNELIDVLFSHLKQQNFSKFYSICNKFGSELNINDSETESDDEEPNIMIRNQYTCEICKQSFDRRYKILYHQTNSHNYEALQHHCPICLMGFCSLPLLTYHQETQCNNRYKKINCDCGMKFQWKENFELHRHTVHTHKFRKPENTKEKSFSCDICSKLFFRQDHLDRHMSIHNPEDKKFECSLCHRHFNQKDTMKWHMRTHCAIKEDNKFLCNYCGRKFSSSSNWMVHIRRHTGEKPYKCDICGKGFPRPYDVQAHKTIHTGEKPWICTVCGKGFAHSNKLTRHIRVHTGVRPFKCTYCDSAFKQSNSLTVHIRRHTGDRPYVCVTCGNRFIHGTALRKHQRTKNHTGRIQPERKSLKLL